LRKCRTKALYSVAAIVCAEQATPDRNPDAKPVPVTAIAECVKRWTQASGATKWAYDGRNNLFAPETLVEADKLASDHYQEFPLEWAEEGRRHPTRYLCAHPHSTR
jgi:hypothetical protein